MLHIAMPADKVRLVCVQTDRFKTSSLIISAALPLDENAAANALMLRLLKRSCKKYPDFTLFYGKLDELYGATVSSEISKSGDICPKYQGRQLRRGCRRNRKKASHPAC